jgi:hypothetical protein
VGSNPTSSASATSSFGECDDRWSALGPLPVHQRGHPGLLQTVGQGLQLGGDGIGSRWSVGIHPTNTILHGDAWYGLVPFRLTAAYRGGRDQGVSGFGWSSPSTQMSARSL